MQSKSVNKTQTQRYLNKSSFGNFTNKCTEHKKLSMHCTLHHIEYFVSENEKVNIAQLYKIGQKPSLFNKNNV